MWLCCLWLTQGDYCNMEFEDNTFDGVYCFESTCHAKDPVQVYSEICRVLKPGALCVDSAWAMTDKYDPQNPEHVRIKDDIEVSHQWSQNHSGINLEC